MNHYRNVITANNNNTVDIYIYIYIIYIYIFTHARKHRERARERERERQGACPVASAVLESHVRSRVLKWPCRPFRATRPLTTAPFGGGPSVGGGSYYLTVELKGNFPGPPRGDGEQRQRVLLTHVRADPACNGIKENMTTSILPRQQRGSNRSSGLIGPHAEAGSRNATEA